MLKFQLNGPFGLTDETGADRRPKLMKSRAVLAVLVATQGHRHSRSWFQTLLWEDRQHEQALSSLRSALADIRRHLGPYASALIADHSDVALDPAQFTSDFDPASGKPLSGKGEFLQGFDIAHASGFEEWLRETRAAAETTPGRAFASVLPPASKGTAAAPKLYLASNVNAGLNVTQMECDALVDSLAKSTDDLSLADIVDGRGRGATATEFREDAISSGCGMMLVSEAAESQTGAIARLKVIETDTGRLVWSKSIVGRPSLDLADPATIAVVPEFADILTTKLLRSFHLADRELPARMLAAAGVNCIFKLGKQNFDMAETMLKRAYEQDPRGRHLAWRAYLRTFLIGEREFGSREAVVEEGSMLASRALENEPHNSFVLALCAHVRNMLHDDYESAFDLSARALELNRCNPLAWASLGMSAAFLGKAEDGFRISQVGAKLANGSEYSFQTEVWASCAGLIAGDFESARKHAERSHAKAPTFAPPLRFLSALYCNEGLFDRARETADKLRVREPGFRPEHLKDEDYPADSLRRTGLLDRIPLREI